MASAMSFIGEANGRQTRPVSGATVFTWFATRAREKISYVNALVPTVRSELIAKGWGTADTPGRRQECVRHSTRTILIAMLQKHGRKYRIDLEEARRLQPLDE